MIERHARPRTARAVVPAAIAAMMVEYDAWARRDEVVARLPGDDI
jgi:hypothetical protein